MMVARQSPLRDARNSSGRAKSAAPFSFQLRLYSLLGLLGVAALALAGRAVELQLVDHADLSQKGDARFSRVAAIPAHRGTITDRQGEPLAVSTPVDSIWINPKQMGESVDQLPALARSIGIDRQELVRRVTGAMDREFLYVARGIPPEDSRKARALDMQGLNFTREYRRYYPAGEVTGHLLGFTNVDDAGQEGLELAFEHWLAGQDGAKRVIQDNAGRKVADVESIRSVQPGRDLVLAMDLRLQYLAYRTLKAAVAENHARGGSIVVIDVNTGEVLAMVNQPTYNPNDREQMTAASYRNRAATDLFEPGSSIKPFVVAAALSSGRYQADSVIDTEGGFLAVGNTTIEDEHPLGAINIATILAKSSNVGMAKVALTLQPQQIWTTLNKFGFGQVSSSGYPGESAGLLTSYDHWRPIGIAHLAYGYGLSVTPLQLAHAYATLGARGLARPVSLLKVDGPVAGERVLDEGVSRSLITLLESVVTQEGATGLKAAIPGYRVAGKTGTAQKLVDGAYSADHHVAVFGGVAPATNPQLAAVVVIDEPQGKYYGGDVSAPVFSTVMGGALRLLGIPPDDTSRGNENFRNGPQVATR
jgi:cell division protein FtsI (penicillin-binding protein 3)